MSLAVLKRFPRVGDRLPSPVALAPFRSPCPSAHSNLRGGLGALPSSNPQNLIPEEKAALSNVSGYLAFQREHVFILIPG